MSIKVQVIFCSMYGHVHKMAQAVGESAKQVPGLRCPCTRWRVDVPVATVDQLADAHAIIFGTPTRFGNMPAQTRNFLDQTGPLWAKGIADRKDRERVRFHPDATWRAGDHVDELPHHPPTSRHGDRRRPL